MQMDNALKKGMISLAFAGAAAATGAQAQAPDAAGPVYKDFADFVNQNALVVGENAPLRNQTIRMGVGITVVPDPKDPMKGILAYEVPDVENSQFFELTEAVTIQPDGRAVTKLAGTGQEMQGNRQRNLYFEYENAGAPPSFDDTRIVNALVGRNYAIGSATDPDQGHHRIDFDDEKTRYSYGSCLPLGPLAAICAESTMNDSQSQHEYKLTVFRVNGHDVSSNQDILLDNSYSFSRDFLNQRERDSTEDTLKNYTQPGIVPGMPRTP